MRSLLRSPGFALTVILTLALGIAANTAIFTVVNAVLLRPLPYEEPDRLAFVGSSHLRDKHPGLEQLSFPDFIDLRAGAKSFESLSIFSFSRATLLTGEGARSLIQCSVSASFFDVLKVRPVLGRAFLPEDDAPRKGYVAVVSHGGWQRLFGADPNIVGREVKLDGYLFTIVGVLPAGFQFVNAGVNDIEIFSPSGPLHVSVEGTKAVTEERGAHAFHAIGRLRPGATVENAATELRALAAQLARQYPDSNTNFSAGAMPLADEVTGETRPALLVLFGSVACVLIVACANVAGLCLVRATARRRELAIRAALGASRGQLLRSLLAESLLLALVAGAAGWGLATLGVEALLKLVPENLPRLAEIRPDWSVLAFTLGTSLLTGLGFGLVPAWQGAQTDVNATLKDGGRGTSGGRGQTRLRQSLVAAQLVVSIVLLISAGLLLRSFERLQNQDPGFSLKGLSTIRFLLPEADFKNPQDSAHFSQRLVDALRTRAELQGVAVSGSVPLSGGGGRTTVAIEGRDVAKGSLPAEAVRIVGEGYFHLLGVTVRGRDFQAGDTLTGPQVAMVNEAFARKHFPNGDALGKRIKPGVSATDEEQWREIVGVVADVRQIMLRRPPEPDIYIPASQVPPNYNVLVLRSSADFLTVQAAVKAELAKLNPNIPIFRQMTMEALIAQSTARSRFNGLLLSLFAGLALLLTAVGVYGVMAQSVALRRGEIGIRLALGATARDVLRMILQHAGLLAGIGVALGIGAAFASTRLLGTLLYGVSALDPLIFLCVPLVLFAVALVASLIPARRAARTDPVEVLRNE